MTPSQFHKEFLRVTGSTSGWSWANGQCFLYAYCFMSVVGGEGQSYTNKKGSGHCFIQYNGLYFDAQCEEGTPNWKKLQRYLNRVQDSKLVTHKSLRGLSLKWKLSNEAINECETIIKKISSQNRLSA